MGQYHILYNIDKKERVHPHNIDIGAKLYEQVGFLGSTSTALFALVANSNGRGGGDFPKHPMVGRWAGDRIVVQGDYAEPGDPGHIPLDEEGMTIDKFTDISEDVYDMLLALKE